MIVKHTCVHPSTQQSQTKKKNKKNKQTQAQTLTECVVVICSISSRGVHCRLHARFVKPWVWNHNKRLHRHKHLNEEHYRFVSNFGCALGVSCICVHLCILTWLKIIWWLVWNTRLFSNICVLHFINEDHFFPMISLFDRESFPYLQEGWWGIPCFTSRPRPGSKQGEAHFPIGIQVWIEAHMAATCRGQVHQGRTSTIMDMIW